jgi:hypothetical protein
MKSHHLGHRSEEGVIHRWRGYHSQKALRGFTKRTRTLHVPDVSIGTSHVIDRRNSRSQDAIPTLALQFVADTLHAPHAGNPWSRLELSLLPKTRLVFARLRQRRVVSAISMEGV